MLLRYGARYIPPKPKLHERWDEVRGETKILEIPDGEFVLYNDIRKLIEDCHSELPSCQNSRNGKPCECVHCRVHHFLFDVVKR